MFSADRKKKNEPPRPDILSLAGQMYQVKLPKKIMNKKLKYSRTVITD